MASGHGQFALSGRMWVEAFATAYVSSIFHFSPKHHVTAISIDYSYPTISPRNTLPIWFNVTAALSLVKIQLTAFPVNFRFTYILNRLEPPNDHAIGIPNPGAWSRIYTPGYLAASTIPIKDSPPFSCLHLNSNLSLATSLLSVWYSGCSICSIGDNVASWKWLPRLLRLRQVTLSLTRSRTPSRLRFRASPTRTIEFQ